MVLAMILAGCGSSSDGVMTGGVTGAIHFVGGPHIRHWKSHPGLVSVFDASGTLVADQWVRDYGQHFRMALRPGRYELVVGRELHPPRIDCPSVAARVRANQFTYVVVTAGCGIP